MDKLMACMGFFWITWNLGCLIPPLDKEASALEKHVMRIGAGLAIMIVLGVLFNALRIPLDLFLFISLSTLIAIVRRIRRRPSIFSRPSLNITREDWSVLCVAGGLFLIFFAGAMRDPLLEDDDPWAHAAGVSYVAVEKNLNPLPGEFHYINPYPPGYDFVLGMLHQVSLSMTFTLKFFNVLFIALGIVFFYFFAARLFKDKFKAAAAAFILACIPCYLTRFIWAHALAVSLFPVVFYFLMRYWEDKDFLIVGVLCLSAVFLTQPDESVKLVGMILIMGWSFWRVRQGTFKKTMVLIILAATVSMLWWSNVLLAYAQRKSHLAIRMGQDVSGHTQLIDQDFLQIIFSPKGGIDAKVHTADDLLFFCELNRIDAPTGWGLAIAFLAGTGLIILVRRLMVRMPASHAPERLVLGWFLFTLLGISTPLINFPVGLFPYRFWIILAFPVCLLSAYGIESIGRLRYKHLLLSMIGVMVVMTAGYPKALHNIAPWGQGIYWGSKTEISGYRLLQQKLSPGTRVFAFTDNLFVIGADMRADFWSAQYKDSFADAFHLPIEEFHRRLRVQGYQYVIISARDIARFGKEAVTQKGISMAGKDLFKLLRQERGLLWIYKVVG